MPAHSAGNVTNERIIEDSVEGENWLVNGGNFRGEHYSPLATINDNNVLDIGLDWSTDIPVKDGITGTPIVVDGVIYVSTAFSHVYAVSADTGKILWTYRPGVEEYLVQDPSISWLARVNRGVAVLDGNVFVATVDCRLVALNAADGKQKWTKKTCDPAFGYFITDAPRVGAGKVFVGNGGSESHEKNRGFVTAYDGASGDLVWRFYTVPSSIPEENDTAAMKMAAVTWDGDALEIFGGGGSAWNEMTYDPDADLLIFGTAGAIPYIHKSRSPAGLDNLFNSSVVAINAETGQYVWHYQTVPEDNWDYNATMNIVLADLKIDGAMREVAMIAPKNGFFYVLDKLTGELLAADKFAKVTWATHVNLETGRPVLDPQGNFWELDEGETTDVWPNMWGAHSVQPMAYHPQHGLVYIPVADVPSTVHWSGIDDYSDSVRLLTEVDGNPHDPGKLIAWDPMEKNIRWSVPQSLPFNGGILSTAGNLVFQGDGLGAFSAYAADDGELLWSVQTGSAISATPVTFNVNGRQVVLIPVGAGGGMQYAYPELHAGRDVRGPTRLMAFSLNGNTAMPAVAEFEVKPQNLPDDETPREVVAFGAELYADYCGSCHGKGAVARFGGSVPDLRYADVDTHGIWNGIVIGGALRANGMPSFELDPREADAIRLFVLAKARELTASIEQ